MKLKWRELARLSEAQLAALDIAAVHLACAEGLPGAETIDHDGCIAKLDHLAGSVRGYTDHCLSTNQPHEPEDTEARVRMRCLGTVVWQGAGIRYNPAKIPENAPWDLRDTFIHGALFGPGGTCATLPIVYVAIGRRLDYPLKLVSAWAPNATHLFCRWDGGGERFNVEVNATGVSFPTDNHYRRHALSPEREKDGRFLQSMTSREELASFLAERACCWKDHGRLRECVDAFAWAAGLSPENGLYLNTLTNRYNEWLREVKRREPPGFPQILLKVVQRRYPDGLPLLQEQEIIGLTMTHNLLNNQEWENQWWFALRIGDRWAKTPSVVLVDSLADRIDFSFRFPA